MYSFVQMVYDMLWSDPSTPDQEDQEEMDAGMCNNKTLKKTLIIIKNIDTLSPLAVPQASYPHPA